MHVYEISTFEMLDSNGSFGTAIKPKAKRQFLSSYNIIILHITKNDFNCSCIFFEDLPHVISGLLTEVSLVLFCLKFFNSA